MTFTTHKIVDAIICLIETETAEIKAGQLDHVGETADRKARLMLQLSKAEPLEISSEKSIDRVRALKGAIQANIRTCQENIEAIRELIDLHLAVEREIENDGTYAIPSRLLQLP